MWSFWDTVHNGLATLIRLKRATTIIFWFHLFSVFLVCCNSATFRPSYGKLFSTKNDMVKSSVFLILGARHCTEAIENMLKTKSVASSSAAVAAEWHRPELVQHSQPLPSSHLANVSGLRYTTDAVAATVTVRLRCVTIKRAVGIQVIPELQAQDTANEPFLQQVSKRGISDTLVASLTAQCNFL